MKNGRDSGKWTLRDLVDFEILVAKTQLWRKSWRVGVREQLEDAAPSTEKARRRIGLRRMLEDVRDDESAGSQVVTSARMISLGMTVLMFLIGVGVVRGLLTDFSYQEMQLVPAEDIEGSVQMQTTVEQGRGFNVWILLAVTLGLQWCFLIIGVLGYWLWRKWSGSLTVFETGIEWLIRKASGGKIDVGVWAQLKSRVRGGRSVLGWRLTRLLQAGGVGYNLGLLVGLFGCLWFLNVGYFWETSLPQFGAESLNKVTRIMSLPTGDNYPGERAVVLTQANHKADMREFIDVIAHSLSPRQRANLNWSMFFFFSLAVYGLFPRLLMWFGAWWMERKSLASLDFQESHHRNLWREVTKVERGEVRTSQADGVVVLDIGGLEIETEELRPFFLQELRVNPEERFSLGTLDQEGEVKALESARQAAMGVVILVEGWNLSPKQMSVYHTQIREAIGPEHMIRYLVLGNTEELKQWTVFVDGLKDSETGIYQYEAPQFDDSKNATKLSSE